jgi:hypothetical protein
MSIAKAALEPENMQNGVAGVAIVFREEGQSSGPLPLTWPIDLFKTTFP